MIPSNKKILAGWAHGGSYQIFIFRVFFSFNAVASLDYISLRAGGGGQAGGGWGGGGQGQSDFFVMGDCGGFKTNLGVLGKLRYFFSITSVRITFFSNGRVMQEGGMIHAN